ncbi:Spo0B domain-containing protein [Paenibacillus sp. N1-5-1-14]|uniref:Spo0B domain-containing protein n=1 Tax=Paenibacillus radicibacter TaxID=2972488 RepID=UPI00215973DB|nr:Spo0B domain-containing protein [Paenibacillus radicibacter]MCR8644133.1 Spo0B domain-containing protein [Paenibacillus radicibacter]
MSRRNSATIGFILSILAVVAAIMLPWHIGLKLILAGIAIALGTLAVRSDRAAIRRQYEEKRDELDVIHQQQDEELLRVVNRFRHDWMNHFQIIFGYIQLKKVDNLQDTMEKIKGKMLQDSFLSKLGIPSLIVYLLKARMDSSKMELEIDIVQEVDLSQLPIKAEAITALTRTVVSLFQEHAQLAEENPNVLSVQYCQEGDALLCDFVYQGIYDQNQLERSLEKELVISTEELAADEMTFGEQEAVVTIRIPFQTG